MAELMLLVLRHGYALVRHEVNLEPCATSGNISNDRVQGGDEIGVVTSK